jgi:hypothetical protein
MVTSHDQLKTNRRFELADPNSLESLEDWSLWLEAILHGPCYIFTKDDGQEVRVLGKQLVERLDGLRIVINPKEHPPPHFHLKSPDVDATFAIDDCRHLEGKVTVDAIKKIRFWHRHSKPKLVEIWNATRPADCVVGKYRDV